MSSTTLFRSAILSLFIPMMTEVHAQVPFGLRGGLGFSAISRGLDPNFPRATNSNDHNGVMGHAGIFLGGPIDHVAAIRSELTIKVRRQSYAFSETNQEGTTSSQIISMQIPLLLAFRAKSGIRGIIGPGFELPLAGSAASDVLNKNTGKSAPLNTNFKERMRSLTTFFLLDAGYAFKNGSVLALRTDLGQANIWKKKSGTLDTNITDISLTFEYNINARPEQGKSAK